MFRRCVNSIYSAQLPSGRLLGRRAPGPANQLGGLTLIGSQHGQRKGLSNAAAKHSAERNRVFVVGVGTTKFYTPGKAEGDYPELVNEAGNLALKDAGISFDSVEQAVCGYVYGESTSGQRAIYTLGMTGIPIYNVNNNAATGSTALLLAAQMVGVGGSDCVMAVGFDKMDRGPLTTEHKFTDRPHPVMPFVEAMGESREITKAPITAQFFGNAGREHMERYGSKPEHFIKIAYKNHKHATNNPNSQNVNTYSFDDIASSPMIYEPLTRLQCCPTSDGAAAAIVCSQKFVIDHGLEEQAVEIVGMTMATDTPAYLEKGCMNLVGYAMTKRAADNLFGKTGLSVDDVDVVELHDCFSTNELITYEALGLCPEGKAAEFVDNGDNTYGGKYVVNPSGGLIAKGHPLGATGIAQCAELCLQIRGAAATRQVPGANLGLQQNIGLGGAVVCALYRMGFP